MLGTLLATLTLVLTDDKALRLNLYRLFFCWRAQSERFIFFNYSEVVGGTQKA